MRPMLAATVSDLSQLRFPLLVTPKLDGIRCLKYNGAVLTRAWKPVPNHHVASLVATLPDGVDGELVCGDFNSTQSAVMCREGRPAIRYFVFDMAVTGEYQERVLNIPEAPFVEAVLPERVDNLEEFLHYEQEYLNAGYEGIMARDATGPYKFGRSTMTEHWLLKYKRYDDSEAEIIGFEEQMQNCNPIQRNAFGRARRPGGRALSQPKGTLGALRVRDIYSGTEFSIGTGFDDELREALWASMPTGAVIRYKYQGIGSQGRPRFPTFLGFRSTLDTDK